MTRSRIHPFAPQTSDGTMIEVQIFDEDHGVRHMGMHGHDFFEFLLVIEGRGAHRVNGRLYEATAGMLFGLAPGDLHDCAPLRSATGWLLLFKVDALASTPATRGHTRDWRVIHPALASLAPRVATRSFVASLSPPRLSRWASTLAWMHEELGARQLHYAAGVRAALDLLLIDLVREPSSIVSDASFHPETSDIVARVLRHIDAHALEGLTAQAVARAMNRSLTHLTTATRRQTGQTIGQRIVERRIAEARRLLVESDLFLDEIAARVGYADAASFARAFRRLCRLTPSAWRDAHR